MSKYRAPDGCRTLWMMVSSDKYELPLIVCDSAAELSRIVGVTENTIYSQASRVKAGKQRFCHFVKVRVKIDD